MKEFDENELRSLLLLYRVCDPPEALVMRTKVFMREEMARMAVSPAKQYGWMMLLVGMSIVLSLNLFYILTVGTVLHMFLAPQFMGILKQVMIAFTLAEGCILAVTIMLFYFKQVQYSLVRTHVRYNVR
jgi:hypothetical protein